RRNNLNPFRSQPGKMTQEIFLGVLAVGLKIIRMPRAQTVGDIPAQTRRPTEKFRVMDVLNIVHGEHSWLPAVEAAEHRSRSVEQVRFGLHELSNLSEKAIAGNFIET